MSGHKDENDLLRDGSLPSDPLADAAPITPFQPGEPLVVTGELTTDLGNARRIVRRSGADIRYVAGQGWHVWDCKRWRPDDTGQVDRYAKQAIVSIFDEVKLLGYSPQASELASWAVKSQRAGAVAAAIQLARTEPEVVARPEDFDANPWVLNVQNGTLDLRSGEWREHRRQDLITKVTGAKYVPGAKAPDWEAFLSRILPDVEVRSFVQRLLGAALVGEPRDQVLPIFFGTGANGKSTLVEVDAVVRGDYGIATPFQTFTSKRDSDGPSDDLAMLAGARLVVASEPPEGARLNIAVVKRLTGGDRITARRLYRSLVTYRPTFTVVLVTNFRPLISDATEAAWRRVLLVPFQVEIPAAERDPDLQAKLLTEREGILSWLVAGNRDWQKGGLRPPPAVLAATAEYRGEEDPLESFLHARCQRDRVARATANDLYREYAAFAREAADHVMSQTQFGRRLAERGFKRARSSRGRVEWFGIGLRQGAAPKDVNGSNGCAGTPSHEGGAARSSTETVQTLQTVRPPSGEAGFSGPRPDGATP